MRIVIPCYRSASTLPRCLDALLQSRIAHPFEIVIVDDGENGNPEELLHGYPVQIIRGRSNGSAAIARNRGTSNFTGEIVVFLDADVEVEPDALERLTAPIREGRAEATVGNYSSNTGGMNFAQKYKQLYLTKVYSRTQGYIENHYWTALGAIRMTTFSQLGGFASHFPGACGEDMELGQRMTAAGCRILAVPDACGRHLKQLTVPSIVRNDFRKGSNCVYLSLRNHSSLSNNRHSSRMDMMGVLYAFILLFFPAYSWLIAMQWQSMILFLPLLVSSYLVSRADLLSAYKGQGNSFFIHAVLLTWLLDLVRGVCVPAGASEAVLEKAMSRQWIVKRQVRNQAAMQPHVQSKHYDR